MRIACTLALCSFWHLLLLPPSFPTQLLQGPPQDWPQHPEVLGWKRGLPLSLQLLSTSLCSTHLCPQGVWQSCWHSWKDEKFQAVERAALTPLPYPRQLSCCHSSPLEVMSCRAPQCKSQKVSCLRKTINKKYQDYCLPHLQISPAHIFLSDNLCLPVSSCSNTSSFPKMDWSSWRLWSHLFKQTNLKNIV